MDHSEIFKEASHISKVLNDALPHVNRMITGAKAGMSKEQLEDFNEKIKRTGLHDKIKKHNENMQDLKAKREAFEKIKNNTQQ